MANFDLIEVEEKNVNKTVLAISSKTINHVRAEKMVRDRMFQVRALLPPANVKYNVSWFSKKIQRHPTRTFIVYDYPAPPAIEASHLWDASDLEDSINRANDKFINHSNR